MWAIVIIFLSINTEGEQKYEDINSIAFVPFATLFDTKEECENRLREAGKGKGGTLSGDTLSYMPEIGTLLMWVDDKKIVKRQCVLAKHIKD